MPASIAATRLSLVALVLLSLAACGGPAPEPKDEAKEKALGRDTDATVFDDMVQTQDKARAVEDLTLGRKDELDRALEATDGDQPDADE